MFVWSCKCSEVVSYQIPINTTDAKSVRMLSYVLAFLVMLNPFALFVYVKNVREELPDSDYYKRLIKANIQSFVIYTFFAISGTFLFHSVFRIDFESFRIFGGIVLFSLGLVMIIQGRRSVITLKGNLDDIASEVAIPFIVGPGSITVSIIIGNDFSPLFAVGIIALAMIISFYIVYVLSIMRKRLLHDKSRKQFDKKLGVFLRLNGFFIGSIGVNMIVTGINNLYIL